MSTVYYLIDKETRKNRERVQSLLNELLEPVKQKLNLELDHDYIDASDIERITERYKDEILDHTPDDYIIICHTRKDSVSFRSYRNFTDIKDFESKFNEDIYFIEDEYGKNFTLDEFKNKVL